jgi:disulfide bond formation protein DsbB
MPCPTSKIPDRLIPLAIFVLAAAPLAGALLSQYGFGLAPCHLCILQRIPYAAVMALAALAFIVRCPCFLKAVIVLSALAFLSDAGLALFHTGVELQWWQGMSWWGDAARLLGLESCSGGAAADSIEALRAQLLAAPVARCDQPPFIFLGLSMAGWNGVYALFATVFTLKLACRKGMCGKGACDAKPE